MFRSQRSAFVALMLVTGFSRAAEPIRDGEDVVVVVKDAPMQKGLDILTRVPNGTRLTVLRTRDGWIRAAYSSGGTTHEGWIDAGHVAPAVRIDSSKTRKLPDHLARFARLVLDEGLREKDLENKAEDPAKVLATLKETVAQLTALSESDSREFRELAKDAVAEVEWCRKVFRSIQEHPDLAGLPRDSVATSSIRIKGAVPQVDFTERTIAPSESLNTLKARFLHCIDEVRALSLRTAAHVRREGGPAITRGQALGIDFVEPHPFEGKRFFDSAVVDPFDNPDRLRLTNASGVALTNCIVEVKLVGARESCSNVHFVAKWPAGQVRSARYYQGIEMGQKRVMRTTARAVEHVEVSISAEELSQEKIVYRYDTREKEHTFREYVGRAKITGDCERYVGLFGDGYRVRVAFEEIPYIPSARVKARIKRNGVWTEEIATLDRWRAGKSESIDFPDVNKLDVAPTEFEAELEFRFENQSCTRQFTWKK